MQQNTDIISKKKAIINFFLNKNIIVNATTLQKLTNEKIVEQIHAIIIDNTKPGIEQQNHISLILSNSNNINENTNLIKQQEQTTTQIIQPQKIQQTQNQTIQENENTIKIISEYQDKKKKKDIQDFVGLFRSRYKTLEKTMHSRQELQNLTSINRLSQNKEQKTAIIGMIYDKQTTKNENIMLTLEDDTGTIKAVVSKSKADVYKIAKDLVMDEVIGITGALGENIIFVNSIIFPDIPLIHEFKKAPDDAYALILSDIHVGSVNFLEEEFKKFISWIRAENGTEEQKELARKVKYVFIVGDLIDGVGIYPIQEKELTIKDVYAQYKEFTKYIDQIPKNIKIIISTGNHDAVRLAEPQPKITKELCPKLWQMPNVTLVGNPSIVQIHSSAEFPGFDVLFYHGYSYDYYGDTVESIRNSGRHISDRNDIIMRFLLERRHLAPTYTSTPYIPDATEDPLVIEKIPDFFLSGHVHKSAVGSYRGVQIISGSCWQAKTAFQEKVGHEPEPCRVPLVSLKTRQVKMLRFDNPPPLAQNTQATQLQQIPPQNQTIQQPAQTATQQTVQHAIQQTQQKAEAK